MRDSVDPARSSLPSPGCRSCRYADVICTGGGTLSYPGAAELPPIGGPLSPSGDSASTNPPSQSAINQSDWRLNTVRGRVDQRELGSRPRFVGVVRIWKDF